jgi:hypothetical protein
MSKSSVSVRDMGLKRIMLDMHNIDRFAVKVGVQSDAGENDGVSIAVYAAANEFGATIPVAESQRELYFKRNRDGSVGNRFVRKARSDFAQMATVGAHTIRIPERSFMRSTFDEQRPKLEKRMEKLFDMILHGKMVPTRALEAIGMDHGKQIQRKITTLRTPPNAPSTIRRKGSSNPLIDAGQMRAVIRHAVEMKK